MESEAFRNINNTSGPRTQSRSEDEGKAPKQRASRCSVLITVSLGLVCLLLLVTVMLQYFMITAEREEMKNYKNTANQTKYCIRGNYSGLTLDLDRNVPPLSDQLEKTACKQEGFFISMESKNWPDSRQHCRDHGGDLVMIKSEEKQRLVSSFVKERIGVPVWIGLSDAENEGSMKWVDHSPLNKGFWMKGEPSNNDGNEDCVIMNLRPDLLNWNDIPCSDQSYVLCE